MKRRGNQKKEEKEEHEQLQPDVKKQKINEKGAAKGKKQEKKQGNEVEEEKKAVVIAEKDAGKEPKINEYIDHTVLKAETTLDDIKKICNEAMQYNFAAICIPCCYVKDAKQIISKGKSKVQIATVIGFPLGHMTTEAKIFETEKAIKDGADEIDMVINIGYLKSGRDAEVQKEIALIKKACGKHVLKVIIETCYLDEDQIKRVTKLVEAAGADFIKTSTGMGSRGASLRDVEIFKEMSQKLKIKAAGGIRDKETALKYIALGITRIGTSSGVQLMQKPDQQQDGAKKEGNY